jgi:antagonist of KipI
MPVVNDSLPVLRVSHPGLLTTIQDLGRVGHQRLGVSPCGAMDALALRIANRLVGNPEGFPCLETTLTGLTLETLQPCGIAVTGADLSVFLNREPIALYQAIRLRPSQRLIFRKHVRGSRAYLAIGGGFQAEDVLGSRSTDLRNGWGGLQGRSLRKGDLLFQQEKPAVRTSHLNRGIHPQVLWQYQQPFLLRALAGPQSHHFPAWAMEQFFGKEFQMDPSSSRMGYRLKGPCLFASPPEIISVPVPQGAVQVLPNGQAVLLMADHQTVGGYPIIAVVISADLPKAAQLNPGNRIRFKAATLEEAYSALRQQEYRVETGVIEY